MDVSTLTNLISTVGYPIVVGFVMMYYVKYQGDQHKEEMDKIREALENNTRAIDGLRAAMGEVKEDE